MIKKLLFILTGCVICVYSYGDEYYNSDYKFSLTFSKDWVYSDDKEETKGSLLVAFSTNESSIIRIDGFRTEDNKFYQFKNVRKHISKFAPDGSVLLNEKFAPFHNIIRNKIIRVYQYGNEYIQHVFIIRNKTLFCISLLSEDKNFEAENSIVATFEYYPTIWHNLNSMRSNLGWFWGSLLLSLFPFLGFLTGKYRQQYKLGGINKKRYYRYLLLSLLLFSSVLFLVRYDYQLMIVIASIILILWLIFFFKIKFLMDFIDGFFGN
jgi:hypothetical protein